MRLRSSAAVALIFLVLYAVYPYVALYRLSAAVESGDANAIDPKVDWQSVRQGLKDDLKAAVAVQAANEQSESARAFTLAVGARIIDGMVDSYATPQAIATLGRPGYAGQSPPAPLIAISTALHSLRMGNIIWAFFDGPTAFLVYVQQVGAKHDGPSARLRFDLSGGYWKLVRISFPIEQ